MPYKVGSGPDIEDVFHSPNVYANNVPIALWLEPVASAAVGVPESTRVSLSVPQQQAIERSAAQATSPEEQSVGLAGVGEVPQEGPVEQTELDPRAPSESDDLYTKVSRNLDFCLFEAQNGSWKETGSNQKIISCYSAVGFNIGSDQTPWCAAFAGAILKRSGAPALKTLSSLAYKGYGTEAPLNDPSKWRLNDVIVFSRKGGGHIGFFRGFNQATGAIQVAGGNQSDNLTLKGFPNPSSSMPVVYVGRAWSVPAEFDKPAYYSGTGSAQKVV